MLMTFFPGCESPEGEINKNVIHAKGRQLVIGEEETPIILRGVNFNNLHWEGDPGDIINSNHHTETDFQRIAEMGMNVIRFNLSYVLFESDETPYSYLQSGRGWLAQNLVWARAWTGSHIQVKTLR